MRHDNSGLGAGWFLDKVCIHPYLYYCKTDNSNVLKQFLNIVKVYLIIVAL